MEANDKGDVSASDAFDEKVEGVFGELGIEVRDRLVGQDNLRFLHEGAGDGGPLPLAAAERFDASVSKSVEADLTQDAFGLEPFFGRIPSEEAFPGRDAAEAAGEDVVDDAHAGDEVEFLVDHGDAALQDTAVRVHRCKWIIAADTNLAGRRVVPCFDDAHKGRFSGAAPSEEENPFAAMYGEMLDVEGTDVVVDDVHVVELDKVLFGVFSV